MIGGLLVATVATLFFVPAIFALIRNRRHSHSQSETAGADSRNPQSFRETEAASLAAAAAAGSFAALTLNTTQLQANKAIRLRMGIQ